MPKTRRLSHEGTLYHDSKRDIWVSEFRWTDSEGKSHKKRMSSMYKSEVVERMDQFVYDLKLDKDNPERFNRNFEEISRYWLDNIMSMKVKPSTIKGAYIKNISVASTMGPGIKVNSDSLK